MRQSIAHKLKDTINNVTMHLLKPVVDCIAFNGDVTVKVLLDCNSLVKQVLKLIPTLVADRFFYIVKVDMIDRHREVFTVQVNRDAVVTDDIGYFHFIPSLRVNL